MNEEGPGSLNLVLASIRKGGRMSEAMLDRFQVQEGIKVRGVCDLESVFMKRVNPLKDLREWQVN